MRKEFHNPSWNISILLFIFNCSRMPPWLPTFNYDTLMKDKEMRVLTTDELIYLIQYNPATKQRNTKKTNTDPTLINALKLHHSKMTSFITPKIAVDYLEEYNNKRAELNELLRKLREAEQSKNNRRKMMANIHGINSNEEVVESFNATNIRIDEQEVLEKIKNLDNAMKQYFKSENDASLAELKRFYNLDNIRGGKYGRRSRSKKSRRVTRKRR